MSTDRIADPVQMDVFSNRLLAAVNLPSIPKNDDDDVPRERGTGVRRTEMLLYTVPRAIRPPFVVRNPVGNIPSVQQPSIVKQFSRQTDKSGSVERWTSGSVTRFYRTWIPRIHWALIHWSTPR